MSSDRFIICILKAFLNNQVSITIPDSINWDEFTHMTDINSISGIVGYVFDQLSMINVPEDIRKKYSDDFFSTIALSTIRDEEMKSLIVQLNKCGINHMLFKGYVIKDLYTVPELRTFGDIDFAIKRESRKKCNELMLQRGYRLLDNWEPVYSYESSNEHYEIHTELLDSNLNNNYDYQSYFQDYWKHGVCISQHTFLLSVEYHLLFLLLHIAKHVYSSGAGIRMYLDIAFYLREYRTTIDWVHFQNEVETLKLDRFVNTVFTAVENWFGIESPIALEKIDKAFLDEFLKFTINGGVFGYSSEVSKLSQVRKNSNGKTVNRAGTLIKKAFPSVNTIKTRYVYLDKRPWLLPIAWVHRFLIKKRKTVEYINEGKRILTVKKKDIIELNDFYRKIGL